MINIKKVNWSKLVLVSWVGIRKKSDFLNSLVGMTLGCCFSHTESERQLMNIMHWEK